MEMNKIKEFSLSSEEREMLEEKLQDLYSFCILKGVPMFATVAVENNEDHTQYKNCVYGSKSHDFVLKDDQICNHILIADGFKAVPPREVILYAPEEALP